MSPDLKNCKIIGHQCVLVPYQKEHVLKYHQWMQSEELLKLTASEPLTLPEEYEMQQSWSGDVNKYTFIILDKTKYEETRSEIDAMIGDTNLFFASSEDRICAEAEIMIAEQSSRHRGFGKEAILLMFLYGIHYLHVKQFVVKIAESNDVSLHLFKSFGFIETSKSNVFQEITLCKIVDTLWTEWLRKCVGNFQLVNNKKNPE